MIVILGGSGFVGEAFRQHLQTLGVSYRSVGRREVSMYDADRLATTLQALKATFVINCAGFTGRPNVDACELQKAECLAANASLPGVIAQACRSLDLPWGHVSSGCIYTGDGPQEEGFSETDLPNFTFRQNNCSFYSGCKALGEETLVNEEQVFLWRLRVPFNRNDSPRNYISKLMRYETLLEAKNSLSHLGEFVAACFQCWQDRVPFGIYNITNPGSVTTREVVEMIQRHDLTGKQFQFFASEEEFMELAAKTPRSNCLLDCRKAINAGLRLTPVHEALERSMREWRSESLQSQVIPFRRVA